MKGTAQLVTNKVVGRIFVMVLSLFLVLSLLVFPSKAFAEVAPDWQVDKAKTATPLNRNYETKVTLSLPAAETEISEVDIVFVLDESYDQEYTGEATTLLNNLINNEKLRAKVGVVKFDAWAHDAYSLAVNGNETETGLVDLTAANMTNIESALSFNLRASGKRLGGSNTEMPLRMAQGMLDKGSASAEKYIVFCSDMRAYVYEGQVTIDGTEYAAPASRIGNNVEHQGNLSHQPLYNSFDQLIAAYTDGTLTGRADYGDDAFFRWGSSGASWNTYWTQIYQGTVPFNATLTAAEYGDYETAWLQNAVSPMMSGFDKSLGLTYDAFNSSIAQGTNFMLITDFTPQAGPYGYNAWVDLILPDFIKYMDDQGADVYELEKGATVAEAMSDFNKKINYLVASGSVKDEIGDKFDMVMSNGECPFTLVVGGTTLGAVKTADNQWSFGEKDANTGKYPYVATYTPGADESFDWEINVPVEKANMVQMSYNLKLNDRSKSGTFATNKSAILKYTDSLGTTTGEEAFEVPTVKFVAPGTPGGGPTSGTIQSPKTGDMNHFAGLMGLLLLSSAGALVVSYRLNKHSKAGK